MNQRRPLPLQPELRDSIKKMCNAAKELLDLKQFNSARFFADKAVTVSNGHPEACYLLARCHFLNGEFGRVLHLLKRHNLKEPARLPDSAVERLHFMHLVSMCQLKTKKYEHGLATLASSDSEAEACILSRTLGVNSTSESINIYSCICLTRALIWEGLENRIRALKWFKLAVQCDVRNIEAFDCILSRKLMRAEERGDFINGLVFPNGLGWLKMIYRQRLDDLETKNGAISVGALSDPTAPGLKLQGQAQTRTVQVMAKLQENNDILATKARVLYFKHKFEECHNITKVIVERDPYHNGILAVHFCVLVETERKADLFLVAHQLVKEFPKKAISWFGVGCYYYLIKNYDLARRSLSKATKLDPNHVPSWIAFGHSFTYQDASDQALAAYRTAHRLFQGCHIPLLCIGMEHRRTFDYANAENFFTRAKEACSRDPHVFNELGVLAFMRNDYARAEEYFKQALKLCEEVDMDPWEEAVFNLGHTYRRMGYYHQALKMFYKCLAICGTNAHSVYAAIGITHHFLEDYNSAIQNYHKSLCLEPRTTLTNVLLRRAMERENF